VRTSKVAKLFVCARTDAVSWVLLMPDIRGVKLIFLCATPFEAFASPFTKLSPPPNFMSEYFLSCYYRLFVAHRPRMVLSRDVSKGLSRSDD